MAKREARRMRTQKGIATVVLVFILAIFILMPLAVLGFEISRYNTILSELQAVTDAASLAGTAALASAPSGFSYADLNRLAMQTAVDTFEQNSILGVNFNKTNVTAHLNDSPDTTPPSPKHATLNITLLDVNGNQVPTDTTQKTAVKMRVQAIYTELPAFFGVLQNEEVATAVSDGGLPQIDLFLCFDLSGSMDDQTPVNLVRRYWNPAINTVDYKVVKKNTDIYTLFKPPKSGTGLNCHPPMNLSFGSYGGANNGSPYEWSESTIVPQYPASNQIFGLRANQLVYPPGTLKAGDAQVVAGPPPGEKYKLGSLVGEQGLPPGNFDPSNTGNLKGNGLDPDAYATGFTDLVVKVPDQGPYTFPNLETCVEASRGNLEDDVSCLRSMGGVKINPVVAPRQSGYYKAYWDAVLATAEPMASARQAATNFFTIMNISSNGHFAFQAFSTTAGTVGGTFSGTNKNVDSAYSLGGTGTFPNPLVELDSTDTHFQEVLDAINGKGNIPAVAATGQTNIADSLSEGIKQLTDQSRTRSEARKAIILFTDGVPNLPVDESTGASLALAQASIAKTKGIPIYTIGLSTNNAISSAQNNLLGDGNGTPQGIAYRSGNGAFYVKVNNAQGLNAAFQSIARSLVVLQLSQGP